MFLFEIKDIYSESQMYDSHSMSYDMKRIAKNAAPCSSPPI